MKYQIGDIVICETGFFSNHQYKERLIIEDVISRKNFSEITNHAFLIIGINPDITLCYLLLVPGHQFGSLPIESYSGYQYDQKYLGNKVWSVTEEVILGKEYAINTGTKIYGGNCRRCGNYNEYAEVDENKKFTCYGCRI